MSKPNGPLTGKILDRLFETVDSRRGADPKSSYTARLFARGTAKIAQKVGEEAVETVIEAVRGKRQRLIEESADLLYHLTVLWADAGVQPEEVWEELMSRDGLKIKADAVPPVKETAVKESPDGL